MWADACIYNDYWGIGRKLASIDPLRHAGRASSSEAFKGQPTMTV